jgi:hypothetical protein
VAWQFVAVGLQESDEEIIFLVGELKVAELTLSHDSLLWIASWVADHPLKALRSVAARVASSLMVTIFCLWSKEMADREGADLLTHLPSARA